MSVIKHLKERLLILKIKHGDAGAYAEVYDLMVEQIFRFISFRVPTTEIAQDITSDVFLKVWEKLSGGDEIDDIRAYFYRVGRNLIADHYRKAQPLLWDDKEVEDVESTGEEEITRSLTLGEIESSVKKLKPEWQEVVVLAYIEGFSLKEVADIIGKSHGTTRVLLHRALNELKKLLK
jgi:RNA polymerase sigma-70 factor (ECF subfamily)